MLLSYSMNCLGISSSTGEKQQSDTTYISVPITYIRLANERLIEREYLLKEVCIKDTIIMMQNKEINTITIENNKNKKRAEKAKKRARRGISVTSGLLGAAILSLIFK